MERKYLSTLAMVAAITGVMVGGQARAQSLQDRVRAMEEQLKVLKGQLEKTQRTAEQAKTEAKSEDTRNIKWHLGGYATADYTATDAHGSLDSFGAGQFNPIFLINYKDLVTVEGELELSIQDSGETKTALEFGNINLNATDWLTLTGGRFLSPIGDFQQHQHPGWINKLPDRPAGFVEDGGIEHLSEVGVMARGAMPFGSATVDYALFVGNGPRLAEELVEGVRTEGFGTDDNNNKAVGGRIGVRPLPYVNVGVGGLHSRILGNKGDDTVPVTTGDYNLVDVDAAYTKGNWDIRGEYVHAHLDSLSTAVDPTSPASVIPSTTWQAWFAQAAYRLAGITSDPIMKNVEPVFRYSQYHVSGIADFKALEENRYTFGVNYWFAPSAVVKVAYENKDYRDPATEDENVVRVQGAFGF